mmetsp:Transcript_2450/g.8743  ORF Transcript_2450/g.8743 Transcript_2450/m.8743 type:complete len:672 (-) Transcript_2450:123-2138(-)
MSKSTLGWSWRLLVTLEGGGNLLVEGLVDLLAVELHGCGEKVVVRGPLLVAEDDVLDELETLQAALLADGVELLHNHRAELVRLAKLLHVGGQAVLLGPGHHLGGVRVDQRNVKGPLRRGVDASRRGVAAVLVDGLQLLQRDVLAVGSLDEVLDPVDDAKGALLIPLTNVTSAEPPVDENLVGLSLVLVVALGEAGAAHPDLALGAGLAVLGVAHIGAVDELDLEAGHGSADVGESEVAHAHDGAGAACLRESVSLAERDTEAGAEVEVCVVAERRATSDHPLHLAAEQRLELVEHDQIQQRRGPAAQSRPLLDGKRHLEDELRHRAARVHLLHDARLDLVVHQRHASERSRPQLAHVALAVLHVRVRERGRQAVANFGAVVNACVLDDHGQHVGEGEVVEVAVVVLHLEEAAVAAHRARHGAVRDHHALGVAGGARRVHDARQVLLRGRRRLPRVLLAELDDVVELDDLEALLQLVDRLLAGGAGVDDALDVGQLVGDVGEDVEERAAGQHVGDLGLLQGVDDALLAEVGVDREHDQALAVARLFRQRPLDAGLVVDRQLVLRVEAEVEKARGELLGPLEGLSVCLEAVGALLEALPDLLLAIDHPLLGIHADEFAVSQAGLGAIEAGGPLEALVESVASVCVLLEFVNVRTPPRRALLIRRSAGELARP